MMGKDFKDGWGFWAVSPLRPGHTPAFASLRVPFRFSKGDGGVRGFCGRLGLLFRCLFQCGLGR